MKWEFLDKWGNLNKKLPYPFIYFNSIDEYQKPDDNMKKEDFFSKVINRCPVDNEIDWTKEIVKVFSNRNCEGLFRLHLKNDFILLPDVFEKFLKVSVQEIDINSLYNVSLPG